MAQQLDPYRVLGLSRGASLPEVKRAYRRLAKANHPDAAGPGALPRFLAIQAAYDQLAGTAAPPLAGGGTRPQRPWDADPARTDTTRRAYGRQRRPEQDAGDEEGGSARSRTRPTGARPTGARPSGAQPSGARPSSARPAGGHRAENADSKTQAAMGKATLGSTSYDGAEPGPFEPDWGGASWYGTTSGTYWTLNPKEYADPRKHGPEYQARARRAAGARDAQSESPTSEGERTPPGDAFEASDWSSHTNSSRFETVDDRAADETRTGWGTDAFSYSTGRAPNSEPFDLTGAADQFVSLLTNPRAGGLRGRAVRALLGWLPVALGIAWIVGEMSGCGRFSATCDPSVGPLTTAGQGIVLAVLFLVPEIAALASGAALIVLSAAVVASLILSATGTAADEASRRAALGALLVVAWVSGLLIAIVRRVRIGPGSTRPVS